MENFTGKTVAFIEVITKGEPGKETGSSTMERARAFAVEYGDGECWRGREYIRSRGERQTEWSGGRVKLRLCVDILL